MGRRETIPACWDHPRVEMSGVTKTKLEINQCFISALCAGQIVCRPIVGGFRQFNVLRIGLPGGFPSRHREILDRLLTDFGNSTFYR